MKEAQSHDIFRFWRQPIPRVETMLKSISWMTQKADVFESGPEQKMSLGSYDLANSLT